MLKLDESIGKSDPTKTGPLATAMQLPVCILNQLHGLSYSEHDGKRNCMYLHTSKVYGFSASDKVPNKLYM